MTPAEYVTAIVLPTVIELRDDCRSRRRAYLACIAVFHVKDYLAKAGETDIEVMMRVATGDAFDLVRGVCNGSKHVRTDARHQVAFTAGADTDRPPSFFGSLRFGVSRLGDIKGGRDVRTSTSRVDVYGACSGTLRAFVATFPAQLGACDVSGL